MTDTQLLVALVLGQYLCAVVAVAAINAWNIRRRVVRLLWGSDRIAARMARWLRRGNRCFSCASPMTEDEREYYGTSCNRCEARACVERHHV
jgi:hypothetical protein